MKVREFFRRFGREAKQDNLGDIAAMMTYYAVFALFPMILFVLMIAAIVVPPSAVEEALAMATARMPQGAGDLVREQVGRMQQTASGGFAALAAVAALWGASRGAVSLGRALNDVYDLEETRPWWRVQLTAIAVTLGVALLLVLALGLLAIGPALGHRIADRYGLGGAFDVLWTIARWIGAALLVMLIWAILYRFLPDTDAPFRLFTIGAAVGVLLWIGATILFGIYVGNFGDYQKTFGALAGVAIFLLWTWISNGALLVGAEINDVLDVFAPDSKEQAERRRRKARKGKPPPRHGTSPTGREPQPA